MAARPRNPTPPKRWHKHAQQWYVKLDGVFHYLGKDEKVAEEKRRRLVGERLLHGAPLPRATRQAAVSVAEALEAYLLHVTPKQAAREFARTQRAVGAVLELYGSTAAGEFDQLGLQAVRAHLLHQEDRRSKKAPKPLSRRYVNHLVKALQQAWTWLESQKLVPNGASAALRTVKALRSGDGGRETKMVLAVPPEVVTATLPYCSPVVAAMIQVQQLTGARPGELVILRPRDIARSPGEKIQVQLPDGAAIAVAGITVGTINVWVYAPPTHKTRYRGKYRLIAIGPKAQAVLAPFWERDALAFVFSPREAMDALRETKGYRKTYAPKRTPGKQYTTQSYGKAVGQAIRRGNRERARQGLEPLPDWRPNQLRHAAGTLAGEESDRDTTAAVLGHATPDMSAVYAEQAVLKAAILMARIG